MSITSTVTLKAPIILGETQVTEITLRKPCAGDMRGVTLNDVLQGDINAMTTVLPRIVTPLITPNHVSAMALDDLMVIQGAIIGFLAD